MNPHLIDLRATDQLIRDHQALLRVSYRPLQRRRRLVRSSVGAMHAARRTPATLTRAATG